MKFWILAEFRSPQALVDAGRAMRERGHRELDAFTPYPVEGIEDALGLGKPIVAKLVGAAGLLGALTGYGLQYYVNNISWVMNVGGRPPHSPATYIPIVFELTILFASATAFFSVFALGRLPRLHHPFFEAIGHESASVGGYWLGVCTDAPPAEHASLGQALAALGAASISVVEDA